MVTLLLIKVLTFRYVLDDRKMYKPKEEIHVHGYIRDSVINKETGNI